MGTISAGTASIPAVYAATGTGSAASPYGSLSAGAIDRMRQAGIADDVIGIANGIVAGSAPAGGDGLPPVGTSGGTVPVVPGTGGATPGGIAFPADQMDQSYPALTARHVAILRMLGLPEPNIQALASANPNAVDVESRIQGMLAQPAMVDQYLGVAAGTTAARAAQIPASLLTNPGAGPVVTQPGPPVDAMDASYPALTQVHVMVLRRIGTPENVIATIASGNPNAAVVDEYIQKQIMVYPERWDAYCGNPEGTARAGLQALGLPVGSGDGTITIPTIPTVPGGQPVPVADDSANTLMKGLVWGAVAIGVGFLAYKFLKGRGAKEAAQAVQGAQTLGMAAGAGGARTLGMTAGAVGGGAGAGLLSAAEFNALRGLPPVRGDLAEILNASLVYGADMRSLLNWSVNIEAARTGGMLGQLMQGAGGIAQAASHAV